MIREQKQLLFAIKHYWTLCKRLYPRINPETKYLNEEGVFVKVNYLYTMHLASCCFRIASIAEKNRERQSVYKNLGKTKDFKVDALDLSILIRDTVSHNEDTTNQKYIKRREYSSSITLGEIHSKIDELISTKLCWKKS